MVVDLCRSQSNGGVPKRFRVQSMPTVDTHSVLGLVDKAVTLKINTTAFSSTTSRGDGVESLELGSRRQ